jgi:hypothetical protein
LDEATERFTSIDRLITPVQWERSAIVYAWTYKAVGRPLLEPGDGRLTLTAFAALGLPTLKSRTSVARARDPWEWAVRHHGALDLRPGMDITADDLPTRAYEEAMDNLTELRSERAEALMAASMRPRPSVFDQSDEPDDDDLDDEPDDDEPQPGQYRPNLRAMTGQRPFIAPPGAAPADDFARVDEALDDLDRAVDDLADAVKAVPKFLSDPAWTERIVARIAAVAERLVTFEHRLGSGIDL